MKERVLITGASGFLGYHLIVAAINNNFDVYAAVRKSSNVKHLENLHVNFVELNYGDVDALEILFKERKIDYVIHASGTTKANNIAEFEKVNTVFTCNIAKAAEKSNIIKRFVFISSLAAVGPAGDFNKKITENDLPSPVTAYGKSKLAAETFLQNIKIPLTVLRPTAIYGPREKDIFTVTKTIKSGLDVYIGKIEQKLSFVYATDMAVLAVSTLKNNSANGVYNITDGGFYNRYEYANIVKQILNKKALRLHIPTGVMRMILFGVEKISAVLNKVPTINREKLNELMATNWDCDISKAKNELGYKPQYDLRNGLKEATDWYLKNKWL